MTPAENRRLRQVAGHIVSYTEERNRLIRQAVASGASLREVAAAAGLSHMAVSYIANGRKR